MLLPTLAKEGGTTQPLNPTGNPPNGPSKNAPNPNSDTQQINSANMAPGSGSDPGVIQRQGTLGANSAPTGAGGTLAPGATFRTPRNKAPVYTSDKRAKFTQRENKKWIRLATVFGYIVSVSFPAITLSIYYTFFWNPDYASRFSQNDTHVGDTLDTRVQSMRATLAPVIEAEARHEAMLRAQSEQGGDLKTGANNGGGISTPSVNQEFSMAPGPGANINVHKQVCAATCERMCNAEEKDKANFDFSRRVRHLTDLLGVARKNDKEK